MADMACKDVLSLLRASPEVLTYLGVTQIIVFAFSRFIILGIAQAAIYHTRPDNEDGYCSCYKELFEKHSLGLHLFLHGISIVVIWFCYLLYSELKYRWHRENILPSRSKSVVRKRLVTCYKVQTIVRVVIEVVFIIVQSELFGFKVHEYFTCGTVRCSVPNPKGKFDFLLTMMILAVLSIVFALVDLIKVSMFNNDKMFPALFDDYSLNSSPSTSSGHNTVDSSMTTPDITPMVTIPSTVSLLPKPIRYFYPTHYEDKLKLRFQKSNLVAIAGIHGCGKTQLSLHFGQQLVNSSALGLVAMINGESTWTIIHSLRLLRYRFNLPVREHMNINGEVGEVELESVLQQTLSALVRKFNTVFLLFDNVQCNGYVIESICAKRNQVLVLVTTNNPYVFLDRDLIMNMSGFTEQETVDFFRRETVFSEMYENDLIRLGRALQNLPLGVAVARAYLSKLEGSVSVDQYIELLLEPPKKASGYLPEHMGSHYSLELLRAIQISVDYLQYGLYSQAADLFLPTAFLYGPRMSLHVLQELLCDNMQDFLLELKYMCLGTKATSDGVGLFAIHSATQAAMFYSMAPKEQDKLLKNVMFLLKHQLDDNEHKYTDCHSFNVHLVPQVYSILNHLTCREGYMDAEMKIGQILLHNAMGSAYTQRGLVEQAFHILKQAKFLVYDLMQTTETELDADIQQQMSTNHWSDESEDAFCEMKANIVMGQLENISVNNLGHAGVVRLACSATASNRLAEFLENVEVPTNEYTAGHPMQLTSDMYDQLLSHKAAVPIEKLSKMFLSELLVHVLYSLGQLHHFVCVLKSKSHSSEKVKLIQDIKFAKRIALNIYERFKIPISHSVLIDRNILLSLNYEPTRISREDYITSVQHAYTCFVRYLEEEGDFYELGFLGMSDLKNDPYHNAICQREIVRYFITMIQLEHFQAKSREELLNDGQTHCNKMLRILIRDLQERKIVHDLSTFYNTAADFLLLYRDDEHTEKALQYYMDSYVIETSSGKVQFSLFNALIGLAKIYRQEGKNHEALEYARECIMYAKLNYSANIRYRDDAERIVRQVRMEDSYNTDCDISLNSTGSLKSVRDYQNLLLFT